MLRLTVVLYSLAGTLLAGIAIIITLIGGHDSIKEILTAAITGAMIGVPLAFLLAWRIAQD